METYGVQLFFNGQEDDAISLRKSLAQSICDEFGLNRVFDVQVELIPPRKDLAMALCMVELEDGLDAKQICRLMSMLPEGKYMPIEFHENNTSAYGFVESGYYQTLGYMPDKLAKTINPVLDDVNLESSDSMYIANDGHMFYMGYITEGGL